jgi:hypothetical protein
MLTSFARITSHYYKRLPRSLSRKAVCIISTAFAPVLQTIGEQQKLPTPAYHGPFDMEIFTKRESSFCYPLRTCRTISRHTPNEVSKNKNYMQSNTAYFPTFEQVPGTVGCIYDVK